ncbi:MAG: hypothetical protein D3919_02835 [Candidatus Electrothrix sp. AW5]|nr:hypothetical protein [Candidatus Electrothrix gigas]
MFPILSEIPAVVDTTNNVFGNKFRLIFNQASRKKNTTGQCYGIEGRGGEGSRSLILILIRKRYIVDIPFKIYRKIVFQ